MKDKKLTEKQCEICGEDINKGLLEANGLFYHNFCYEYRRGIEAGKKAEQERILETLKIMLEHTKRARKDKRAHRWLICAYNNVVNNVEIIKDKNGWHTDKNKDGVQIL